MKKTIFTLAVTAFIAGTISTGCDSQTEKKEVAQEKVQDAKESLNNVQNNANTEVNSQAKEEDWKTFKAETEKKIADNEERVTKLKVANNKSGKTFDAVYEKRIDALEQKNRELRTRIDVYSKSREGWESFKREWNHDMDELGQSLKDLSVKNTK